MVWDPRAIVETVHEMDGSDGQARVWARPWTGAERLRYEDALAIRIATVDGDGDDTVRLGTMRLIGTALTLTRAEGFPDVVESDGDARPFDPRSETDLTALRQDVYAELVAFAQTVQPLPGSEDVEDDDEAGAEAGPDVDPSRTSSTRPAGKAGGKAGRAAG